MPPAAPITPQSTMIPLELTLIVAATRNMGIGRGGSLPWSGLKKEMAYFARVTKRLLASSPSRETSTAQPPLNAVIMGRKTWDSIPEKFRPLKGRLNIVLSRSYPSEAWDGKGDDREPVKLSSIDSVLGGLSRRTSVAKVFVIGGAEIYAAAINLGSTKRILLTRVLTDFDCDTFFPTRLDEGDDGEWKMKSKADLDGWVGEDVSTGKQEENGISYVFEMYERD